MSDWMRKVLESKQQMRKRLATFPFSEKIKLLEKLRDRSLAIALNPLRQNRIPGVDPIFTAKWQMAKRSFPC